MSVIEILGKAIEFDEKGHILQALKFYKDALIQLRAVWSTETDPVKKNKYQQLIINYDNRIQILENQNAMRTPKGEIRDQILILDGSTHHSFESIFDKYLDSTVIEVTIEEPYLKIDYQLYNLVTFCELLVLKCANLKFIRLLTTSLPQSFQQQTPNNDLRRIKPTHHLTHEERQNAFQTLLNSLRGHGIAISYEFNDNLHHRQIILSNGFVIKICRGLHYFKPLTNYHSIGAFNQNFRECLQTNIDILYCPAMKK